MQTEIASTLDDIVSFGPFRLAPARRRLEKNGVPVRLGARALDLLLVLIAHAPDIVSKHTLLEQAWPGVTVEEANLRFQMIALRRVLGDERYISTVSGRGYCFVEPLSRTAAPAEVPPATNLPQYLTRVIGRDLDLAELQRCLAQHRLVTLVGPGGVGKTRLAVETGRLVAASFPAGAWLIDLAPLTDPDAIAGTIAGVLDVALSGAGDAIEAVAAAVAKKRMLLVFDNCEHLVAAAAALIKMLLERAPGLSVLATSQEALQVPSEQLYLLRPLAVPSAGTLEIDGFGAVDLFVERSRAADRGFELHHGNIAGVVEICRRLDGVPLALEMAAGRLNMLGVEGLCESLADRLRLLKAGQRDNAARHGSLRAMAEWSHGLLDPPDRQAFRRLAVFPSSFSLDDAVAVVGEPGADHWSSVDALGRLIDKSLVTTESVVPPRYRLLETLRLYATEQLRGSGESDLVAEKHARHFADVLGRAEAAWETMPDPDWVAFYRPETHNLRAALDWALAEPARREIALLLAAPSLHFLDVFHLIAEGRRYAERLIPLIDDGAPPAIAAAVLLRGVAFWQNSLGPMLLEYPERAVALYRELDDKPRLGRALNSLGVFHAREGRYEQGGAIFSEARVLVAPSNFQKLHLTIINNLGAIAANLNRFDEAREYLTQAIEIAHAARSIHESKYIQNLATMEYSLGNIDRAIERGREAIIVARAAPGRRNLAMALVNFSAFLLAQGRTTEARPVAEEAFTQLAEADANAFAFIHGWAVLAAFEGRLPEAAQLIGFVDADNARKKRPRHPVHQRLYDELTRRLDAGLPPADRLVREAEGARWTEAEAIEFIAARLISD